MAEEDSFYRMENGIKKDVISKFITTINERTEQKYKFLSGLMIVISTVFAVVITLGSGGKDNSYSLWLYRICTMTNGLSILCYSIALYENLEAYNQLVHKLQNILKLPDEKLSQLGNRAFAAVEAKTSKLFSTCEKLAYITSLLTVILLIAYAWLKN